MKKTRLPFKPLISAQYFLHFAVMGILLPYFNLYCYFLGFNAFRIGLLSSLKSIAMALFPLIWAALADRFQMRRRIYLGCNFLNTAVWVLFIWVTGFRAMLWVTIVHAIFYAPIIPFLEAFTMDLLDEERSRYGRIRAWGSISFIGVVMLTGKVIDLYSIEIIINLVLAGLITEAMVATQIPSVTLTGGKMNFKRNAGQILKKRVLIFLVCAFLMLVSHGTYYGFYSIHLNRLGFSKAFIGITWAVASMAEICVMLRSESILKRFSIDSILTFSLLVAIFRWVILFAARSRTVILASQLAHAATYGTFHIASIIYMDSQVPDGAKTLGQAVNNGVTYGFGLMVGLLINGYFYERLSASGMFFVSALIALAASIMWIVFQTMEKSGSLRRKEPPPIK